MKFQMSADWHKDKIWLLSAEEATIGQRRRALLFSLAIGLVTLALIPVAQIDRIKFPELLAAYQTAITTAYLIAAYLIFSLYRANQALSSLYLCGGCFYAGAILLAQSAQSLSIPLSLASLPVLSAGSQTSIWFWSFIHGALPLSIALYALSEWVRPGYRAVRPERTATWFGIVVLLLLAVSIAAVTVFHDKWMPVLEVGGDIRNMHRLGVAPVLMAITAAALLLLWRATEFYSALQVWLGVALVALLFDNVITIIGGHRLSVGWYAGRIDGLISAGVMLLAYLGEMNRAYLNTTNSVRHLANANALLEAKVDQAGMDFLTGLPGRARFIEQVRSLRARNVGNGTIVAVLVIDLDGFKQVNDTLGHEQGDKVLIQTAEVLRAVLRDTDIAGRFGGDEFVVCLFAPYAAIQAIMINIAGRIVTGIGRLGSGIGCSIGISLCIADRLNLDAALQQADKAMYLAKKHGKNRFVIHGQAQFSAAA